MDIYSRLYRDRIVICSSYIDESAANNLIAILLYLQNDDNKKPITLYCNIPGGELRPSLALYDTICSLKGTCKIITLNIGFSAGMGAFLVAAGSPGSRYAMPNSRFLVDKMGASHPIRGQASDIQNEVRSVKQSNDKLVAEFAKMTKQPAAKVASDLQRYFYCDAKESVAYGIVDRILTPAKTGGMGDGDGEYVAMGDMASGQTYGDQGGAGFGGGWNVDGK